MVVISCFGCSDIKSISKVGEYEVDHNFGNIVEYTYKDKRLDSDFILIPKKRHIQNEGDTIVISFCPWCGQKL